MSLSTLLSKAAKSFAEIDKLTLCLALSCVSPVGRPFAVFALAEVHKNHRHGRYDEVHRTCNGTGAIRAGCSEREPPAFKSVSPWLAQIVGERLARAAIALETISPNHFWNDRFHSLDVDRWRAIRPQNYGNERQLYLSSHAPAAWNERRKYAHSTAPPWRLSSRPGIISSHLNLISSHLTAPTSPEFA